MLKYIMITGLLLSLSGIARGQQYITWETLQSLDFQEKYVEEVQGNMLFPKFTSLLRSLNGKTVEVKGFVIPIDKEGKSIVLSANPYASCFFCGKAGPASVMTVKLKAPNKKYRTDNYRLFRGTLRLNATNIREFYYILENAEEVRK
ncbi:MAG: hypothetical protein KIT80_18340 [Chitinophagaceae bacterium]|nr:hypothetical protein [Chitinophagaceae bacterium]MCW5928885.1 hypothetical protein [Chitinophagaceae bacterium]